MSSPFPGPALRSGHARKACAIWQATPHPYLVLSPDLIIVDANEAYARLTLTRRGEIAGRHIFDVFPDNPAAPEASGIAALRSSFESVLAQRQAHEVAALRYDIRTPNGEFVERYWAPVNYPVLDERTGELMYVLHNTADATERMKRELLLREAAHRGKNAFAQIAAVLRLSGGSSGPAVASALDRLAVLERNHQRLSASSGRGCGLKELVAEELAPYSTLTNVQLEGPDIPLNAAAAQSLSMVLHELATNAAKHGAWSQGSGHVQVQWGIEGGDDGAQHLAIAWEEENGPPIFAPPARKGFGSLLICDLLRLGFGAQVILSYAAAGLKCRIALPLANVGYRD